MLDIEKLIREGKTLDEIGDIVTNEMNAAQLKIQKEEEDKRVAEQKKKEAEEAAKQFEAKKAKAKNKAVAALKDYLALVLGEVDEVTVKNQVEISVDSIRMLQKIKNHEPINIFEMFNL